MAFVSFIASFDRSSAGLGISKEEAFENRSGFGNGKTCAFSRAPKWARRAAIRAFYAPCIGCGKTHPIGHRKTVCVDGEGIPLPISRSWGVIYPELEGEFLVAQDEIGRKSLEEFRAAGYPTSS